MKNKDIYTSLILLLLPAVVAAQSNIYDKYSDKPSISSVYISKTMLEMQPDVYMLNIGKVASQLDAVYIVSTMDNVVKRELRSDIAEFIKKGKYEVLMEQRGNTSSSSFYVKKKGEKVKELIMLTDGAAKLNYIHLVGEMTLKDIQKITGSQPMGHTIFYPLQEVTICDFTDVDLSWLQHNPREMQFNVQEHLNNIDFSNINIKIEY